MTFLQKYHKKHIDNQSHDMESENFYSNGIKEKGSESVYTKNRYLFILVAVLPFTKLNP